MNQNIYQNLLNQLQKIFKHNRQGSYKTKDRYLHAMKRFLKFLAIEYRLERLANISPKHIFAYVEYLKYSDLSPSYIKTELSAIRFFHDKIAKPRYVLPENS